jgi:hypothetical protein
MAGQERRGAGVVGARRTLVLSVGGAIAGILAIAAVSVGAVSLTRRAEPTSAAQSPTVRALVGILRVLRRPQTEADRNPDLFNGSSSDGLTPVRSLERLAITTAWGAKVYLVPLVKSSGHGLPLNPARGGLGMSVNGTGGRCCDTAEQVEAGQAYATGIHPRSLIMVVPDGVARVSVALAALGRHATPPVATGRVRSNVVAVRLSYDVEAGRGDLITWYAASGAVIEKIRS